MFSTDPRVMQLKVWILRICALSTNKYQPIVFFVRCKNFIAGQRAAALRLQALKPSNQATLKSYQLISQTTDLIFDLTGLTH